METAGIDAFGGSWVREGPESCLLCTPEMNSGLAAQCLALLGEEGGAQETTVQTAAAKALGQAHAALTGDICPALLRPRPRDFFLGRA